MSGTSAFFRGLTRAAQRPALTLLLAATSAFAAGLFALPLFLLLSRSLASQPEAAELLRGSLAPLSNALDGHFYDLLFPLAVAAFLPDHDFPKWLPFASLIAGWPKWVWPSTYTCCA